METWLFLINMENKINEKETLDNVASAVLQDPIEIEVIIPPRSKLHAFMQRKGIQKKARRFILRPIYLGSLIRISKLLIGIDFNVPDIMDKIKNGSFLELNYIAIAKHGNSIAEIVAIAIQNNDEKPNPKLVKFIVNNFTANELKGVLTLVIRQMDLTSFMSSIIAVKGMNVLESTTIAAAENVS